MFSRFLGSVLCFTSIGASLEGYFLFEDDSYDVFYRYVLAFSKWISIPYERKVKIK